MEVLELLKRLTILYVEDDAIIRENIANTMRFFCDDVLVASDGEEGLRVFMESRPNFILTDIDMPNKNGIDFIKDVRKIDLNIPIVIITAHKDEKFLLDAVKLKLEDYILKPITYNTLINTLTVCVERIISSGNILVHISNSAKFDILRDSLTIDGQEVILTKKETLVLKVLVNKFDEVIPYEELEQLAWDGEVMSKSSLKTIVTKLRQKSGLDIVSYSKTGYRLKKIDSATE